MPIPEPMTCCDGPGLRRLFAAATERLEQEAQAINALNVFPVPDGDTGTNLFLTLRAALEGVDRDPEQVAAVGAGPVAQAIARGALIGARGNSGVILSQMLRGFARGLEGSFSMDGPALVRGLAAAAAGAYTGVSKPVEGTMLTVIREAAEAVELLKDPTLEQVLEQALAAARSSLARTPDLLPVLREAGVVDAGGQGIVALLEGALLAVQGREPQQNPAPLQVHGPDRRWLEQAHFQLDADHPQYGYCTEFLVRGQGLDLSEVRAAMAALGDSVLAVGDEALVRVHVHTFDPGAALSYATTHGSLLQVKVENMQEQHEAFVTAKVDSEPASLPPLPVTPGEAPQVGIVAVAPGPGLAAVFRSLGATVVPGGPTMNPSTGDLLEAIARCGAEHVVLLPNNPNIFGAARQAADLSGTRVIVVPSRTVPQGIAATLALNPEAALEEAERAMAVAACRVRTIEVTRAVRTVTLEGRSVQEGEIIALLDERLAAAAATPEAAIVAALGCHSGFTPALLTIYYGEQVSEPDAAAVGRRLRAAVPGAEVDLVSGGQPHYLYIVALEE